VYTSLLGYPRVYNGVYLSLGYPWCIMVYMPPCSLLCSGILPMPPCYTLQYMPPYRMWHVWYARMWHVCPVGRGPEAPSSRKTLEIL